MPRRRFIGQRLVDFLVSLGYKVCPEPEGPPAGLTVLSLDCGDANARIHLVAHTAEQGAPYAEKLLGAIGIDPEAFWAYLEGS